MLSKLKWLLVVVVGLILLQILGVTPRDIWKVVMVELDAFKQDSGAIVNGDYKAKTAASIRKEVSQMDLAPSGTVEGDIQRELLEKRKEHAQERSRAIEKHTAQALKGDVDTLKRQVVENARNAGGGY